MRTPFTIRRGNKALHCDVEERWEAIISRPALCGEKFEHSITKKLGVTKEQRSALEANIRGSFGLGGIAELESSIKATTEESITFEESTEITEKTTIEAPPCGVHTLLVYQKKQVFRFEYEHDKWRGVSRWTLNVEKWLPRFINQSTRVENDPACNCKERKPILGVDGHAFLRSIDGQLGMLAGYRRRGDYWVFEDFGEDAKVVAPDSLAGSDLPKEIIDVKAAALPRYLQFLLTDETRKMNVVGLLPNESITAAGDPGWLPPYLRRAPVRLTGARVERLKGNFFRVEGERITPEEEPRRIGEPIMAELMDPPPVGVTVTGVLTIEASSFRQADLKPLSE